MSPAPLSHSHTWCLTELDFAGVYAIRRFECACGATDFDAMSAG